MAHFRAWLDACRPKTLVAAAVPVAVGAAVAWSRGGLASSGFTSETSRALLSCLGFALGAQVASNFANDLGDSLRGADTAERVGPRRAVANQLISARAMTIGVGVAVLIAFVLGLPVGLSHPVLFDAGILALLLALAYTLGPFPLAYHGLGDVFVIGCFGLQATILTSFALQVASGQALAGMPWWPAGLAGLGLGLLADNILLANNARDLETDAAAGKRTIVVRWGRGFARHLHGFNAFAGLACLAWVFGWLPLVLLPLALWQHRGFRRAQVAADYVPFLARAAVLLLLAGALCVTATCLGWVPLGTIPPR